MQKLTKNKPIATVRGCLLMIVGLLVIGIAGCSINGEPLLTEEEVAVYRSVIRPGQSKHLIVSTGPMTAFGITKYEDFAEILPSVSRDLATDFLAKNREDLRLEHDVILDNDMDLMGSYNREERLSHHPVYHSLSRVGFDKSENRALVHYYFACGALCGDGAFYLLENRGGVWIVID